MFWRVEFYEQTTTIEVSGLGTLAIAIADEPEQRIYGNVDTFDKQLKQLPALRCHYQHKESLVLVLTTYGVPFVVDSPDLAVTTQIKEDWALIQSPCVFNHRKVWAYYEELSRAIECLRPWNPVSDRTIYPEFRPYYQKLLHAIAPEIDADKLRSESRHELCVCTSPVERDGQQRLGLSGVMQLLGYKPATPEAETKTAPVTDADPVLALIADCTLIFKRQSGMLLEQFGVDDLSQIANHASSRLEAARVDSESQNKTPKRPIPIPRNTKWEEVREGAIAKLSKLNVPLPKNF